MHAGTPHLNNKVGFYFLLFSLFPSPPFCNISCSWTLLLWCTILQRTKAQQDFSVFSKQIRNSYEAQFHLSKPHVRLTGGTPGLEAAYYCRSKWERKKKRKDWCAINSKFFCPLLPPGQVGLIPHQSQLKLLQNIRKTLVYKIHPSTGKQMELLSHILQANNENKHCEERNHQVKWFVNQLQF